MTGSMARPWPYSASPSNPTLTICVDAPSLTIVPALIGSGAKVRVVDPQGKSEGEALLPGVEWSDDPYAAAKDADVVVLLTEWKRIPCAQSD